MKFSIMNLGCKVNAYESESIASELEERGHTRVDFNEACDASLIFTCAVTNLAASKSRKMMHRAKRNNEDGIVAVVGCYAQVDEEALEDADIIVGSKNKIKVVDYVEKCYKDHEQIIDVDPINKVPFESLKLVEFEEKSRGTLKIQDGCNQFCSYCIIPYARGRERSMEPNLVIEEVKKLEKHHNEIVLAGIHTGRYGKEYGLTLADLIQRILNETNVKRIRISSIEVSEIDEKLMNMVINEDRIANHLHIPLQAGCDETLKRMNRPYTTSEYYDKIVSIKKAFPTISISSDIIVGFVGESDEEFEETCAFIRKCELSFLHVFQYSLRDGTAAEKMDGHIDPRIKKKRAKVMADLSDELYDTYKQKFVGRTLDVLVEGFKDGYSEGYSSEYLPIKIVGKHTRKEIVKCKVIDYKDQVLYAERCE